MKKIAVILLFLTLQSLESYSQEEPNLVNEKQAAMIGLPAPEFTLFDLDYNEVILSELEGKAILIDFWASWCRYCRVLNRENSEIYELYKDRGFQIVSVSFDTDYYKWKKASELDNINWMNLNEHKGMESEVGKLFYIDHTPTTFLLDSNKTILAIEIEGDELEEKIQELLK